MSFEIIHHKLKDPVQLPGQGWITDVYKVRRDGKPVIPLDPWFGDREEALAGIARYKQVGDDIQAFYRTWRS